MVARCQYERLISARNATIKANKAANKGDLVPLKVEIDRLLSEFFADQ
jgi:hypothetical protein